MTAQTLPMLFGLSAIAVQDKFAAPTVPVRQAELPATEIPAAAPFGYLVDDRSNSSSLYALIALTGQGAPAYRLTGAGFAPGTIYLPPSPGLAAHLGSIAAKFPLAITAAPSAPVGTALEVKQPRLGLYQSWVASLDEGWTRWIPGPEQRALHPSGGRRDP